MGGGTPSALLGYRRRATGLDALFEPHTGEIGRRALSLGYWTGAAPEFLGATAIQISLTPVLVTGIQPPRVRAVNDSFAS